MQWNLTPMNARWAQRLGTLVAFLCLGASLAYWTLHWPADEPAQSSAQWARSSDALPAADSATLTRLLGSAQAEPTNPASNAGTLHLVGVVARGNGVGSALIAPEGLAQKSFPVGSVLPNGLVLQSVTPRQALLATSMQAPVSQTLELPSAGAKK
jgi:hypothetical protein